jgi:hypothetical protein
MTGKITIILRVFTIILFIYMMTTGNSLSARIVDEQSVEEKAESGSDADDISYDSLILSGRIELIEYLSYKKPISEEKQENHRFYFNNIYINLEGYLHNSISYIVEFQALTSYLYLFGGFVTVAESLEGMDTETTRQQEINNRVIEQLEEIREASQKPNFERAMLDFNIHPAFGIKLGKVRNPFGFWDDFSLFRNLSFIRTDPVTLGVPIRRTDMGGLLYGSLFGRYFTYELGILDGEFVFKNYDTDKKKDAVVHLETHFSRIDFGVSGYIHDAQKEWKNGSSFAGGVNLRFRMTDRLTFLGEYIHMINKPYDLTTRGGYGQINYDLSDLVTDGLRLNLFFEVYNSDLTKIDLDEDSSYRFQGSYIQGSAGFLYTLSRNIDFGLQAITGLDEDGDKFVKGAFKVDAKF